MTRNGHASLSPPTIDWQGDSDKPYRLLRIEDTKGRTPRDGHDPWVPHRIGFHAIMLVSKGSFDHWLDFQEHRFDTNCLIYIAPNQVHHFVKNKAEKVWALMFRPEILPTEFATIGDQKQPWSLMSLLWPSHTMIPPRATELIDQQLDWLQAIESTATVDYLNAARHCVCSIVSLAFEFATKGRNDRRNLQSTGRFLEFNQLVEQEYISHRNAKWYANQMDCSERTLNRACLDETGKSAKTLLSERVVIEAKRLLIYQAQSVNSIAEKLGFKATSNFIRYFRGQTDMTPQEFRDSVFRRYATKLQTMQKQ